jgi:multiple sugar transport system ATP-binding protein
MAEVRLNKVTKRFGAHTAVEDLTLDVADGEFFVLLGPTGAGKTTTLRLIAGLERPDAGSILMGGSDASGWSVAERDVALVFQYYSLYPRYTVRQNLAFPLKSRVHRYAPAEIEQRIARAAKMLRIEHLLDRKTDKLSGGEMQRVSIGRAIVREPRIFLMDEPLSNLDAKLREALRAELKDLQMKLGATFLFVTHDQIEAMSMGDKVGVLNHGRLVQVGTPQEIYHSPRDTFVAAFVGSPAMNLVDGEVAGDRLVVPGAFELPLEEAGRRRIPGPGGRLTLGVRSEDIIVGAGGAAAARVHDVENHGVEKIVTLRAGSCLFKATLPAISRITIEDEVRFSFNQARLHGFDAASGVNLAAPRAEGPRNVVSSAAGSNAT